MTTVKRKLIPQKGNTATDMVMTPFSLAIAIVEHFKPTGLLCEPCRGSEHGAFFQAMFATTGEDSAWYEITEGRDFLVLDPARTHHTCDWIVTNPPWSQFRAFLGQSMKLADNIVFLAPVNAWELKARRRDMEIANFARVETLIIPTPPKPWPQSGFTLAATWIRRGWKGTNSTTYL